MDDRYIKLESQRMLRIKYIIFLPGGVLLLYCVFAGLLKLNGAHGNFEKSIVEWFWPATMVMIVAFGASAYQYYTKFSRLYSSMDVKNRLRLLIRDEQGAEISAYGPWQWYGCYVKVYAKYGMYKKQLFIYLFSDQKPYCVIRHELGAFSDPPPGFMEVQTPFGVDAPTFYTRAFEELMGMIANNGVALIRP